MSSIEKGDWMFSTVNPSEYVEVVAVTVEAGVELITVRAGKVERQVSKSYLRGAGWRVLSDDEVLQPQERVGLEREAGVVPDGAVEPLERRVPAGAREGLVAEPVGDLAALEDDRALGMHGDTVAGGRRG